MKTAPPLPAATRARVLLPFAIVTLLWGSTWLVIRDQIGVVPISWSVTYRFAAAALTMFVVAAVSGARLRFAPREQAFTALVGVMLFFVNFNLVYRAEAHVTSGLVAVVFALLVASNAVLARIFLHQPLSRPFLAGSGVAMLGVALLFAHEFEALHKPARETALGIALTLAAVACASVANVMQASARARALPMPSLLAWAMLWGTAIDAGFALATSGPPVFDPRIGYAAGVLYLGILASALAFTLYFGLIRAIGPARAGYINVLTPVLAMALSTLFEDYRWSITAALGVALVLAGLVVALRARSPAR